MKTITILFCLVVSLSEANENKTQNPHPIKTWYSLSASELIFSGGKVINDGNTIGNVVRFSMFFHIQHQTHYNFGKHFGVYTGSGIRNIGFINTLPVPNERDATIKQRSYTFGIPLALKLGNLERGNYLAIGLEAECMFNYKRKVLFEGNKSNYSEWFSNDVNTINPSVFAEIRVHHGSYIRFTYYLMEFLVNKNTSFYLPNTGTLVNYKPEKSTLFYISVGHSLRLWKKQNVKTTEVLSSKNDN